MPGELSGGRLVQYRGPDRRAPAAPRHGTQYRRHFPPRADSERQRRVRAAGRHDPAQLPPDSCPGSVSRIRSRLNITVTCALTSIPQIGIIQISQGCY